MSGRALQQSQMGVPLTASREHTRLKLLRCLCVDLSD